MKQNLQFVRIRAGGEEYAQSLVLIWMIVWLIAEKQRLQGEYDLMEQKETLLFSIWERTQICFRQIKETLELSWSGFLSNRRKWLVLLQNRNGEGGIKR